MDFDVVVVGAGPGGCIAARDLKRAGFDVGLFDAEERETLGKPIVVEAEKAMFETVGAGLPQGEENPYHQKRIRVFSANKKEAFTIEGEHPAVSLKLDAFSRRLLREAEGKGVRFYGGHAAHDPLIKEGRVGGVRFRAAGSDQEVMARLVIDATGFNAALVRKLDPELSVGFEDRMEDVVVAENRFHEVAPDKAREAVGRGAHYDDEVWNRLGIHGNYSTVYSYLSLEKMRAYILIGFKAEYQNPPISDLVDRFREEEGYYGRELYGGKGLIRVRRSLDRLVTDGLMVIGEAACQVIPAHGSGVASAMYAGHLAARAAAEALKHGDVSTRALWPYCHGYQSGRGAILAAYDANRMVVESMTSDQVAALMDAGAMRPEDLYNAAVPKPIKMSLGSIPSRAWALLKRPDLIGPVMRMGRPVSAVTKHYVRYPAEYDPGTFQAWKREAQRLFEPLSRWRRQRAAT